MSDWEDEIDVEVEVAIPKKNQWDDEDVDDQVKESWEDSDEEKDKKKSAPGLKKKVPLKQKIAEKLAAEEKKKQELEARGEDDNEQEKEDDFARKERLRQLELEADLASATDLFSGASVSDMKDKPLEEWNPKTRVEMDAYRKRLVDIIIPAAKWNNYSRFIDELLRDIAVPLKDTEVKKVATSLTAIANEKQRVSKEAIKKTKGKSRPQLSAAGKNSAADGNYDDDDDYDDDFM